ncbi:MAG: hypothetical protein R2834_07495 [Rhodothermales bacterium]
MPDEILVLSIIAIAASTFLITRLLKVWTAYVSAKSGGTPSAAESLTSSELEAMLTRVVEEANAPILARIDRLERQLNDGAPALRLPSPQQTILLDEPDMPQDLAGVSTQRGRRSVT